MKQEVICIIEQAQMGDEEAFKELYERFYHSVYYKSYQLTRNEADAKDIVQEVFCEVHRSLPQLLDPQHFYSWLMMITTSRTKNLFRKHTHDALFIENMQELNIKDQRIDANPEYYAHDRSEQEIIYQLIHELPKKYAEVLELTYLKELKLQEVADLLQVPLGTVKTRIVRGRKELQNKILAFEHTEQRKLSFHVDTAFPLSIIGIGSWKVFTTQTISKMKHFSQTIASNAVVSGCVVSFGALAISGGVFVYDDYQRAQASQSMRTQDVADFDHTSSKQEQQKPQEKQETALLQSAFPSMDYNGQDVKSSRDAYFICLNFALKEEDMKEHTKEDFMNILPIYEQLKKEQSIHYQELEKTGWTTLFEAYAYSDI